MARDLPFPSVPLFSPAHYPFFRVLNPSDSGRQITLRRLCWCSRVAMAIGEKIKDFLDEGSHLQRLVQLTMEHPRYAKCYSMFPSYEKDWVVVPLGDISMAMKSVRMISIDCEMVLCQDGTEEVVKICLVDKKFKVKLETLVNPNKAVANYRTEITGVSAEDLVGVTCSLVDVQGRMKKLLRKGTILVGHSLYNDMRALRLEYQRVIDTAYIFKYSDLLPDRIPSLKNLCKAVLGYELRKEGEPHDCKRDAEAAMKLVLAKLEHGFEDPIEVAMVSDSQRSKLLLHRIPVEVPYQELHKVFPQGFELDIQGDPKVRGSFYSTYAVFKDVCEAEKVFQAIEGRKDKDIEGRPQKQVYLKLPSGQWISFKVRKSEMDLPHPKHVDTLVEQWCNGKERQCTKRNRTVSSAKTHEHLNSKVQRTDNLAMVETNEDLEQEEVCIHLEEVDRLKKIIRAREDEIFDLQKILAAFIRKNGL
ncbi:hypothetical protein HPP92_021980 [Vanilla planifolia]|uniref:Exonuclease domain-containing protein n=1 Tax=Vanilla planifolia TaxID=51239 RepID=A0A835PZ74_VANPL|nr:hypothetical protein HPP92_021980 [Vanilla planifolia]